MAVMPVDFWLPFIAVGVVLAAIGLVRHGLLKRAAKNWPMAHATVEICYAIGTDTIRQGESWWIPVLGYSYEVNGERYSGSVGLEGESSRDRETAEQAGKGWRGQKIVVRFNPQKPEKSAFLPEDGAPPSAVSYADQPPDSEGMITSIFK
jgi:hypothetical protein